MQNPFRRPPQPLDAPDDQQRWELRQWNDGELINTTRVRTGIRVPDPAHPIKIRVSIGYSSLRIDGRPAATRLDELEEVENTLIRELGAVDTYLVMVLTGYSAREFIAYGSQSQFLEKWGPTVLERWTGGPVGATGIDAQTDPKWTFYRRFSKRAS